MNIETLREYLKIHIISLEQDLEANPDNAADITGQIEGYNHILDMVNEQ